MLSHPGWLRRFQVKASVERIVCGERRYPRKAGTRPHSHRGDSRRSYHAQVCERCLDHSPFLRHHFVSS
jgi:hypothetical protein